MQEGGEGARGIAEMAAQGDRDGLNAGAQVGTDAGPEISAERLGGRAQQVAGQAEKGGGLFAALHDDPIGFAQQQQGAIGLDGSGEVDLLPLAIGQVRRAEGGGSTLS